MSFLAVVKQLGAPIPNPNGGMSISRVNVVGNVLVTLTAMTAFGAVWIRDTGEIVTGSGSKSPRSAATVALSFVATTDSPSITRIDRCVTPVWGNAGGTA